jgi:hypothetical protein
MSPPRSEAAAAGGLSNEGHRRGRRCGVGCRRSESTTVKDTPTLSSDLNTGHITDVATVDDRMLIVLDMARFLTDEDLDARKNASTV